MKSFLWLVAGAAIGFVVAHKVNETPQGKRFFTDLDQKARDFGSAVAEGYHKREAELRSVIADAEDTISNLTK
jgi:hypothetical protein